MHLPRHTIESHAAVPLFQHVSFCSPDPPSFAHASSKSADHGLDQLSQPSILSCASLNGFMVAQTDPLKLVANRTWTSSQGGLSHAVPVEHTSLLFLVGGGRVPCFAPNKVVLWDEAAEYTTKSSAGDSTNHDSDDDDDGLASVTSRRASTIFSAGSEFDAYGRHQEDSLDSVEQLENSPEHQSRSFSPVNSLRFSTSSLVNSGDMRQDEDQQSGPTANAEGGRGYGNASDDEGMVLNTGATSLGIGRLQASHLSEASDRAGATSVLLEDKSADMTSEDCSHSIMASSANLADPFAEDDVRSPQSSSPPTTRHVVPSHSDFDARRLAGSSSSAAQLSAKDAPDPTSPQGLFSTPSSRSSGARLVDSVSSMATTATDSTAKAPPKVMRGREVAELEFSEVVRGICATSIHLARPNGKRDASKGKGRASTDSAGAKSTDVKQVCVVLVVLLASKAVVFELSPPSTNHSMDLSMESRKETATWRIQKRAALQTYKNLKGLASVAPCYLADVTDATRVRRNAIVAVPGRQKGHVQLLRLNLHSCAADKANPVLSNVASSLGAASIIVAHDSSLAAISLSPNGQLLATASSKGTLIRIWSNKLSGGGSRSGGDRVSASSADGKSQAPGRTGFGTKLMRELRRGTDPATILSLAFAPDASLVAAASDKGTIHIFLLSDVASASVQATPGAQGRSSPLSASSRASLLGRAAAQYLPSGIGNLAGQIPPSVLPQYLKSEWSSAQYRIPLKSFGASSRHYSSASTSNDSGMYGVSGTAAAPVGTEKSTEGAWAQMRNRISDIRKGEANVDEKLFLCWIVEGTAPYEHPSTAAIKSAKSVGQQGQADKAKVRSAPTSAGPRVSDTARDDPRQRYRLIAVTTSGGWYKLAITVPKPASLDDDNSGSTVLDMYRSDASIQSRRSKSDKDNAMNCKLVEFRPMVALLDGWRA
ncbi:related to HSV2 - Phosphatidylinositol 3,5-bisphosphate-binding protein [Ustilago sp. UG-2017a]|nr:related to HSV2 - Phosphatidylinositol 3,5-bisphosphate-binding protein [Ustilago sp. UG-2017a]